MRWRMSKTRDGSAAAYRASKYGQQRAVLRQRRRRLAELLQALGGVVAEVQGLRVGGARLGRPVVGEPAQLGQGAPVLAVVHQRRRVLLAQDADDRGAFTVLGRPRRAGSRPRMSTACVMRPSPSSRLTSSTGAPPHRAASAGTGGDRRGDRRRARGRVARSGQGACGRRNGRVGSSGPAGPGPPARGKQRHEAPRTPPARRLGLVLRVLGEEAEDEGFEGLGDLGAQSADRDAAARTGGGAAHPSAVDPANGTSPLSSSCSSTPRAYRSVYGPTAPPIACSGAM